MGIGRYCGLFGFNFTEACEAVIRLIKDPNDTFTLTPDDPEGCEILNGKQFENALDATDLSVKVRSSYVVNHYDGKDVIEITSMPFEVNPQQIMQAIRQLANKGKFPEISNIDVSSNNYGKEFKLSIEVRKGYDPDAVMKNVYKLTQCENTYIGKYSFVNGLNSVDYTIRIAILEWIRCRKETIRRIYKSERVSITKRIHYLKPLIKVIESGQIEDFIKIVRQSKSSEAVKKIMAKWDLTDYQAEKIIDVKISDLSIDRLEKYKNELKELEKREKELAEITDSHKAIDKIIINQLEEGIKKYGTPRKSKVYHKINADNIIDSTHYLVFTNKYVKKLPYDERGYKIGRVENGDKVLKVLVANNKDYIAIFTGDGRCSPIRVNDIGNSNTQSVGISYSQIGCKVNDFVDAINITKTEEDTENKSLVTITENGFISKTSIDDISGKEKSFAIMKLTDKDRLVGIGICEDSDRLMVYTKDGKASVFAADDFETTSYNTKGVQSAKVPEEDTIAGVSVIHENNDFIVTLTDRGYVKKINLLNMPSTKRNGKMIEINSSGGSLINAVPITSANAIPLYICTTAGTYQLDDMNIKATNRVGKAERAVELKASDYAFEILYGL